MAAFNFPDPLVEQVVENPITGSIYEWKEPPGKWVLRAQGGGVVSGDLIWEGPTPPVGGDHKFWYHSEELELYFKYTDINGNSAWVPTSKPISELETVKADVEVALKKANAAESATYSNLRAIGCLMKVLMR